MNAAQENLLKGEAQLGTNESNAEQQTLGRSHNN